ncbi:MAG TPA: hypothetical protein VF629_16545 [Hymenobacter sp.]|jgi:hypothetical protein|uniref:hypothetical protein n=1 Tax=Hymenobacter sp. TaxID=1898978 RepID=UPI002EDB4420
MRKSFAISLFSVGLLLFQVGCVGLSIVAGTKQVAISNDIGDEIGDAGNGPGAVTDSTVAFLWGSPKRKEAKEGRELWVYRSDELAWRGIEVWAIVPIPLLLPVGFKKVTLEFEDGVMTKYTTDNGRERFFGLFIMNGVDSVWQFNQEEVTGGCHGYYGCY